MCHVCVGIELISFMVNVNLDPNQPCLTVVMRKRSNNKSDINSGFTTLSWLWPELKIGQFCGRFWGIYIYYSKQSSQGPKSILK